jgi:hypothetical protein
MSNCTFCLESVFICFVSFSAQIAIISFEPINQLIFVMLLCGLFEVQTECLKGYVTMGIRPIVFLGTKN